MKYELLGIFVKHYGRLPEDSKELAEFILLKK